MIRLYDCIATPSRNATGAPSTTISHFSATRIALERTDAAMLDAAGLCEGARQAQISISGGETAQLKDIVKGFDLVGMAAGRVALDKVICGKDA